MKSLIIGQIIRSERLKRGISQEDLAFDICTPATLSRLENNLHTPTRSIFTSLLSKIEHIGYISYSSSDNNISFSSTTIYDNIFEMLNNDTTNDIIKFTNDIELYYTDSVLIEQFNTAIDSLLCTNPTIDTYKSLIESIRYTITSYNDNAELDYLLTNNEILLIYALSVYYERIGNLKKAIAILNNLLGCINKYNSELNFSSCAIIFKHLISLYVSDKQFIIASSKIDEYTQYCKTHSIYYHIPDTCCYKTICNLELGIVDPYSPIIEAYYYYKASNKLEKAKKIKNFCTNDLKISFHIEFNK